MKDTSWMQDAACAGIPEPDLFFPNSAGSSALLDAQSAIAICKDCEVINQCGEYARQYSRGEGVWAGRLRTSRGGRLPTEIMHGTEAGHMAHRRRGEKPCGECMRAATLAKALRTERRRTA